MYSSFALRVLAYMHYRQYNIIGHEYVDLYTMQGGVGWGGGAPAQNRTIRNIITYFLNWLFSVRRPVS